MTTNYKFQCDCGKEGCDNYLSIEYFGSNGKPLENVTFTIQEGSMNNSSDLNCSKIPELIKNLQTIYKKYTRIQKQNKLEKLSENNKPNLNSQEERYQDTHPLGLGMNDPSFNSLFSKKNKNNLKTP